VTAGDGELLLTAASSAGVAPLEAFEEALQSVVFIGALTGLGEAAILIEVTDDTDLIGVAQIDIDQFVPVGGTTKKGPVEQNKVQPTVNPPTFQPPTNPLLVTRFVRPLAGFAESDGGAGGKNLGVNDGNYEPPDQPPEAERELLAMLSSARAVRREEIVDAVHAIGEMELVSLMGFDLGDEPVFDPKPKPQTQPPAQGPPQQAVAQPLAVTTEKPVLPDDSSGISLLWAAIGVSGSLWVGGTWWWRRRRHRLLAERARSASAKTISEF
jgi:hypothetical protein